MSEKKMETRAQRYDFRMNVIRAKEMIRQQKRSEKAQGKGKKAVLQTASHIFMSGIMLMYFVGVALGVYVTVFRDEPVSTTLNYIMRLALVVGLGYFVKAFGENIAKIVLPFIFGSRSKDSDNNTGGEGNG